MSRPPYGTGPRSSGQATLLPIYFMFSDVYVRSVTVLTFGYGPYGRQFRDSVRTPYRSSTFGMDSVRVCLPHALITSSARSAVVAVAMACLLSATISKVAVKNCSSSSWAIEFTNCYCNFILHVLHKVCLLIEWRINTQILIKQHAHEQSATWFCASLVRGWSGPSVAIQMSLALMAYSLASGRSP